MGAWGEREDKKTSLTSSYLFISVERFEDGR